MVDGMDGEVLAGRVVMELGSPEKVVTEAVKEVIRILKKTQAASVPQVWLHVMSSLWAQAWCMYVQGMPVPKCIATL